MSNRFLGGVIAALFVALIALIVFLAGVTLVKTDGGHVAVVRNGGMFDDNKIRDVVQPGSSRKFEGMFSQVHKYPASQRYYTIAGDGTGDRPGVDVFKGVTSDGVNGVGIEGTVQFTLDTNPEVLRVFDDRFGTRTFPVVGSDKSKHAWDGDEGWNAFLDAVFRRVLDNALRIEIQQYTCAELIPSCALVRSNGQEVSGSQANANLNKIQNDIAAELQHDLDTTLNGKFIEVGAFRISRVTLSDEVEAKITQANASKVEIQNQKYIAQQKVEQATGEKLANEQKAKGIEALNKAYANNSQKAAIDAIAALPEGLTSLYIGGESGIAALVQGNK